MIYVFLSVCSSVLVSVLLKLARRYRIDVFQAITWNYSIVVILFFFKPQLTNIHQAPILTYSALAILLPAIFVVMGLAVRTAGIVRTDVAQRLSLLISLSAAFFVFNETFNPLKMVGIGLGAVAIACAIPWQKQSSNDEGKGNSWLYLLTVFFGIGVIDILFKQIALYKEVPYTTSLFIIYAMAFTVSMLVLLYMVVTRRVKFTWRHILFGWILGFANFGNILFYLKAHQALSANPSIVFSAMNIGVIIIGTLTGVLIFKEKLTTLNKIGISLAIVAIAIIAYAKTLEKKDKVDRSSDKKIKTELLIRKLN
ncbi:EamA/RhaT family transporter [Mucilaginibacter myungsuensis]|uniref:EamA/RhaT family transporter n=1 Tax=Mucilaginibacter myungsuensis TaxID=649104 RepID=A0A929PYP6_9SPHI|nr:EamA/RhaT family transporter [Mucilaginibacter myungsuensis]MBE9664384.1 EamA/RhaT family transporter [Mucilaginibacter myungsuensis]MDN3597095.1 EamA/RhaT family transporter [Mucilaginibacter myungsuensis]